MSSTKLGSLKIKDSNNIQFNIDLPEDNNEIDIGGNLEIINSKSIAMNINKGTTQLKEEIKDLVNKNEKIKNNNF